MMVGNTLNLLDLPFFMMMEKSLDSCKKIHKKFIKPKLFLISFFLELTI